jgi:dTDP-N-acetylfucosamine:lipid II N-acetylfucosaminyltransferase
MAGIHFLPDSPYSNWFVNNCINCGSDTKNEFYCLVEEPQNIDTSLIQLLDNYEFNLKLTELNKTNHYENLYLHYLDYSKAAIINAIHNNRIKIIWIEWSDDLYGMPILKYQKYDNYSQRYMNANKNKKVKYTFRERLGRVKMKYWDGVDLSGKKRWKSIYRSINRVDYFVSGITEEVAIIQSKFKKSIKSVMFTYVNLVNQNENYSMNQTDKVLIQVGNSSDPSNNHYEVFTKLHKFGITDEILLPLSYGDSDYAKQLIKDISRFIKTSQLVVLREFMAKDEYDLFLRKVRCAIFSHNIQQGFGNIITLLTYGAKIFLKKENLLYSQFRAWGISVFSIEDDLTAEELSKQLDQAIVVNNRKIILDLFSQKRVDELYRNLLSI